MRKLPIYLLTLIILAGVMPRPTTLAQDKPPGTTPATKPAEAKDGVIAELNLRDVPLADLIDFMRDADPTFQAVVSFAPGVDRNDIIIQELRLKNVTAASVLEVLCNAYEPINAEKDDHGIWSIKVTPDERAQSEGDSRAIFTTTHRLREILDDLVQSNGIDRKKALESVVSLITTAIEIDGSGTRNTRVQLHEATETLLFRGDVRQNERVESALEVLKPSEDQKVRNAERRAEKWEKQYSQLASERDRLFLELAQLKTKMKESGEKAEPAKSPEIKPTEK